MASKMLIDAAHPEETRVAVVKGTRVEEFDYESANKKQLRGNIYLAKVTRVEPSLQAAFVDYGGNRHGFLAFSEIHPDYYQIPVADRQALLDEEEAEESRARAAEAAEDDAATGRRRRGGRRRGRANVKGESRQGAAKAPLEDAADDPGDPAEAQSDEAVASANLALEASNLVDEVSEPVEPNQELDGEGAELAGALSTADADDPDDDEDDPEPEEIAGQRVASESNGEAAADNVESIGSEDALEEVPDRARLRRRRPYKKIYSDLQTKFYPLFKKR